MNRLRWFPSSLSSRLLITYVTLMALGIGGVMALTGQRIASENIQQTVHELELQAHIVANALRDPIQRTHDGENTGGRSLDTLIASYASSIGGRVTLLDAQRNVVLSSVPQVPLHPENNQPEPAAASAGTENI